MTKLSSTDPAGNEVSPGVIHVLPTPDIIPFDAAGAACDCDPDDRYADEDDDTPPDHPPTAPAIALGRPCTRPERTKKALPQSAEYTLCAVLILPDPGYPRQTDDMDYIADGQAMMGYAHLVDAVVACKQYATRIQDLPQIEIPGVTHLVVNHRSGTEVYRQSFAARAA